MSAWSLNREWMRGGVRVLVALLLSTGVLGCGNDAPAPQGEPTSPQGTIVSDSMTLPKMLETDDRFSTLRAALDSTGLDSLLASEGPFTLFAPPNDAFEALPPGTMDALLTEQPDRLRTILRRHVLEERISRAEWPDRQTVNSLSGDTLSLRRTQDGLSVEGIAIVDGDIEAANGLLHVTDEVLPLPPERSTP